jgi:hypothetical protein
MSKSEMENLVVLSFSNKYHVFSHRYKIDILLNVPSLTPFPKYIDLERENKRRGMVLSTGISIERRWGKGTKEVGNAVGKEKSIWGWGGAFTD